MPGPLQAVALQLQVSTWASKTSARVACRVALRQRCAAACRFLLPKYKMRQAMVRTCAWHMPSTSGPCATAQSLVTAPTRCRSASNRGFFNMAKGFGLAFGKKEVSLSGNRVLLKPRKVTPMLPVPDHIGRPPYARTGEFPPWSSNPQIHDEQQIKKMRAAGKLAAQVLDHACSLAKAGVTTDEIDRAVHAMAIANNAYPSPLNYGKFPKSVCTSVNECVCHGIPDDRPLEKGDIVNIDVTVFLDGHHGDTSRMVYVGEVAPQAKQLCEVTRKALDEAIKICGPGVPYNKIGKVINEIADGYKYGVVKDFVGHGVGRSFHSDPHILHVRNNDQRPMKLGQTFTIEPMLVEGSTKIKMWKDDWTAVTSDGGLAAQYEHTLLITPDGVEILTKA